MNHPLFIAALLAASTAAIHVFAGGSDVVVPLLASSLAEEPKRTLYAVWNMVSVALVMSAAALFAGSLFRFTHTTRLLVLFVSALWCAFGTVFLVVAALQPEGGWLFRLPQWALLMPAGLLGLWGGCRTAGLVRTAGIPAGSEIGRRLADQRHRDRRYAEQEAFGRCRDGTGIHRVVAHVGAVVDTGHHHVGQMVEHAGHREVHAVGRCAIDMIEAVRGAAQRQRTIQRQRVAGAAAVALGRDHRDFADGAERLGERRDSGSEVAVVVTDQNAHLKPMESAAGAA